MLNGISAAILAGGLGTRLRSVVSDVPKVLAPVAGKPFLSHILDQLNDSGVREAVLCTGYLGDLIEEAYGSSYGAMSLRYSREAEPLGTGGSLANALPLFSSSLILAMNGDSFCETSIHDFHAWHTGRDSAASICLKEVADTSRYGSVLTDENGRVQRFEEKGREGRGFINAGLYLIAKDILARIPKGRSESIEKETFPALVKERVLYGYRAEVKRFIDIGTPESFADAQKIMI